MSQLEELVGQNVYIEWKDCEAERFFHLLSIDSKYRMMLLTVLDGDMSPLNANPFWVNLDDIDSIQLADF